MATFLVHIIISIIFYNTGLQVFTLFINTLFIIKYINTLKVLGKYPNPPDPYTQHRHKAITPICVFFFKFVFNFLTKSFQRHECIIMCINQWDLCNFVFLYLNI